jgi:hypothetical protein
MLSGEIVIDQFELTRLLLPGKLITADVSIRDLGRIWIL